MERDLDIPPRRILDWLRRDATRGADRKLVWRATREFDAEAVPLAGSGIDAEDGLSALLTVGLLEVRPRDGGRHWTLTLRVEDAIGDHLPEDGSVPDEPEPLGLDAFEAAFFGAPDDPDRELDAEVTLTADGPEAERHFERLLAS